METETEETAKEEAEDIDLEAALSAALAKLPENGEAAEQEKEPELDRSRGNNNEADALQDETEADHETEKAFEVVEEEDTEVEEILEAIEEEKEIEKEVEQAMANDMTETEQLEEAIDETATITAGMHINGDLLTKGSVDILGTINGNVEVLGKLSISGAVKGNSTAAEIYADSAKITGEVRSKGSVKIGQSSVIIGNIYATSAVIAGAVKGDIDVQGPVILDTSAIVMGDIRSKAVQINNGAVIEGRCSQCYADVSPTSFFDDYKDPNADEPAKKSK